jgi:hypothetical protein
LLDERPSASQIAAHQTHRTLSIDDRQGTIILNTVAVPYFILEEQNRYMHMPTRKEHNSFCEQDGINPAVCDRTNAWMDAPARKGGGCAHREERHSSRDCLRLALSATTLQEGAGQYLACQLHRELDRRSDRCGSKPLFDSGQTLIPLADSSRFPRLRVVQELLRGRREGMRDSL